MAEYKKACDFLELENKIYTDEEIISIFKKKVLLYHPDKKVKNSTAKIGENSATKPDESSTQNSPSDSTTIEAYHTFCKSIEILKNASKTAQTCSHIHEYSSQINPVYIAPQTNDLVITHEINVLKLLATSKFFRKIKVKHHNDLILEEKIKEILRPDKLEYRFTGIGNKELKHLRGDIVLKLIILQEDNIILEGSTLSEKTKNKFAILPKNIVLHFPNREIELPHPNFPDLRVKLIN